MGSRRPRSAAPEFCRLLRQTRGYVCAGYPGRPRSKPKSTGRLPDSTSEYGPRAATGGVGTNRMRSVVTAVGATDRRSKVTFDRF